MAIFQLSESKDLFFCDEDCVFLKERIALSFYGMQIASLQDDYGKGNLFHFNQCGILEMKLCITDDQLSTVRRLQEKKSEKVAGQYVTGYDLNRLQGSNWINCEVGIIFLY